MSMLDKCRECKGSDCEFSPCLWRNTSWHTSLTSAQQEQRRAELKRQAEMMAENKKQKN